MKFINALIGVVFLVIIGFAPVSVLRYTNFNLAIGVFLFAAVYVLGWYLGLKGGERKNAMLHTQVFGYILYMAKNGRTNEIVEMIEECGIKVTDKDGLA